MVVIKEFDIPSTCHTCKLGKTSCINSDTICVVTSSKLTYEESEMERMPDCPLRELPDKEIIIHGDVMNSWKNGWNDCLDIISEQDV